MKRNIFEIPLLIRKRPGMYIQYMKGYDDYKLSNIFNFIRGYMYGAGDGEDETRKILQIDNWVKFLGYIVEKTIGIEKGNQEGLLAFASIMYVCDNDEKKLWIYFINCSMNSSSRKK